MGNIGPCFALATKKSFSRIETTIKKIIKATGLDHYTSSDDCYRMSIGIRPEDIARKSLISTYLKGIDTEKVRRESKYNYYIHETREERFKPMTIRSIKSFNLLPKDLRQKIIEKLCHSKDKKSFELIKFYLKKYYSGLLFDSLNKQKRGELKK